MFNTVKLYHYTINDDCTGYNICGTWIFDIRIQVICRKIHYNKISSLLLKDTCHKNTITACYRYYTIHEEELLQMF